jgi:putative flippase GtrA
MSKNYENPLTFPLNEQSLRRSSQFKAPFISWPAAEPDEQMQQRVHSSSHSMPPSNGAAHYSVPTMPFFHAPATPFDALAATPPLAMPDRTRQMSQGVLITSLPPVVLPESKGVVQRLLSRVPRRILGFSVVGGSVMMGGIILLFVLVHFLHVEEHLAYLIQAVTSIETNFFLNRFLNWKERDGHLAAQWLKFHSTSTITFPLNQIIFALLTWIGVHYLLVTLIGAGIAAIVNYLANDRFVFHRQDITKRETAHVQSIQPLVSIAHVGIVIPVRNSQRTIRACLASVLEQEYTGQISVFLVGNVPEQDATWSVLGDLIGDPRVYCIQIRRPASWTGRDANLKRYCGCEAAVTAGADALVLLDSQVVPPRDWLERSVHLLQHYAIDGVAGRSSRHPGDNTLPGLYQDCSLFSEWPTYGETSYLSRETFGKARGLPVTNNLLISKRVWEHIHRQWPLKATYSWEDFRLDWEIVCAGYVLCCTDTVCVYRNHQPKFRLAKHFAAGAGAMTFYRENAACPYVKHMLFKAAVITGITFLLGTVLFSAVALGNTLLLALVSSCIGCALFALGIVSVMKARDMRGMLFPLLDILHIGLWIAGAAYVGWREEETDTSLADAMVAWR